MTSKIHTKDKAQKESCYHYGASVIAVNISSLIGYLAVITEVIHRAKKHERREKDTTPPRFLTLSRRVVTIYPS